MTDVFNIGDLIPDRLREQAESQLSPEHVTSGDKSRPESDAPELELMPQEPTARRQTKRPSNRKTPEKVVLLSELLADIPSSELALIIQNYEAAVRDQIILATPLTGTKFKRGVRWEGKRTVRRLQDEAVLVTPSLTQWLTDQRQAARLENLRHEGRIETTLERLSSGVDNLQQLAKLRRERLLRDESNSQGER